MDFYDSSYPKEYYKTGEKYVFYRTMSNTHFWKASTPEDQRLIAPYLKKFKSPSMRVLPTGYEAVKGVTEVISNLKGVTEAEKTKAYKGVTEAGTKTTGIQEQEEGAIAGFKGINKEVGIVIGINDQLPGNTITVLFDDGCVYDYILGQPSYFSQKDIKVIGPKLMVPPTVQNTRTKVPDCLIKTQYAKGSSSAAARAGGKQIIGVTEASKDGIIGVTEVSDTSSLEKGVTEV